MVRGWKFHKFSINPFVAKRLDAQPAKLKRIENVRWTDIDNRNRMQTNRFCDIFKCDTCRSARRRFGMNRAEQPALQVDV